MLRTNQLLVWTLILSMFSAVANAETNADLRQQRLARMDQISQSIDKKDEDIRSGSNTEAIQRARTAIQKSITSIENHFQTKIETADEIEFISPYYSSVEIELKNDLLCKYSTHGRLPGEA